MQRAQDDSAITEGFEIRTAEEDPTEVESFETRADERRDMAILIRKSETINSPRKKEEDSLLYLRDEDQGERRTVRKPRLGSLGKSTKEAAKQGRERDA